MHKILDCTIRDGGHETNWNFSDEFVSNAISIAIKNNCEYFEIGYRNYYENEGKGRFYNCPADLIRKFKPENSNIKIGIMVDATRFHINDFIGAGHDCTDFVRIATHPDMISKTLEISQNLYSRGYNIFIQLMEIPNVEAKHYNILRKWQYKNILKSLYIADTYSTIKPEDIEGYFHELKRIGFENISFHAHNKIGLALENTQRAIELGAYSIDVSQGGLGGNLSI